MAKLWFSMREYNRSIQNSLDFILFFVHFMRSWRVVKWPKQARLERFDRTTLRLRRAAQRELTFSRRRAVCNSPTVHMYDATSQTSEKCFRTDLDQTRFSPRDIMLMRVYPKMASAARGCWMPGEGNRKLLRCKTYSYNCSEIIRNIISSLIRTFVIPLTKVNSLLFHYLIEMKILQFGVSVEPIWS